MRTLVALLGLFAAVALAGCGSDHAVSLGKPGATATTSTAPEQTGSKPSQLSLEVWFTRDNGLVAVRRTHPPTQLVATAAMKALLDGPTADERSAGLTSSVPPGTRLLGIGIRDGLATVDLTSEYQSGGGALSMQTRLGQVVYTLTQFPTVQKVRFRLDGSPVNVFSSEGIVLDHPVGRSDYADLLPAIVVDRPAPGDRVTSPATVSGTADVFEANVTVEIRRREGQRRRQDVHDRELRHRLPRRLLGRRHVQGRQGAARHGRGARRRRGRHGHAPALGADPGHARSLSQASSGAKASSSREVSPQAPSRSSVPVLRSKRGSARPASRSPTSSGST